jgi:hypothetical protein
MEKTKNLVDRQTDYSKQQSFCPYYSTQMRGYHLEQVLVENHGVV